MSHHQGGASEIQEFEAQEGRLKHLSRRGGSRYFHVHHVL